MVGRRCDISSMCDKEKGIVSEPKSGLGATNKVLTVFVRIHA